MDIAVNLDLKLESLFRAGLVDRSGAHDLQHLRLALGVQQ